MGKRKSATSKGKVGNTPHAANHAPERIAPDGRLLGVVIKFVVLFAILQASILFAWSRNYTDPLVVSITNQTAYIATALGAQIDVTGNLIQTSGPTLRVDLECTGIYLMSVYVSLVLAYPLMWRRRVAGAILGVVAIHVVNIVRLIAVIFLAGRLSSSVFTFVHDYLFMVGMAACVVVIWVVYLNQARRHAIQA